MIHLVFMIDHGLPAVFHFLHHLFPATSLPQHPLGFFIHCLCEDLMSLCIQMFLICLAALHIIRSPQISDLPFCSDSFIYCFQFLRHLHRQWRKVLIISLLPFLRDKSVRSAEHLSEVQRSESDPADTGFLFRSLLPMRQRSFCNHWSPT